MEQTQTKGLPTLPKSKDRDFWGNADINLIDMDSKKALLLDLDSISDFKVDLEKRQIYSKATGFGFTFITHSVEIKDGYLFAPYRNKIVKVRLDG